MNNKRRFIKRKLMTCILTSSILLGASACTYKEETKDTTPSVIIQTIIVTATPTPTKEVTPTSTVEPTNTPIPTIEPTNTPTPTSEPTSTPIPTPTVEPTKVPETTTETTEYHSADPNDGINATLDKIYNKINWINRKIDEVDFNKVKESTINYAKDLIDFIFYGGEINGVTFDELKDDAKQKVYEELQKVDSFIMQFIPDYKEKLGEKYNYVKNFASMTLKKAKEIFNSHIEININKGNSKEKVLKLNNYKNE